MRAMAEKIGHAIHEDIPAGTQAFLSEQRMVMLAAIDGSHAPWASVLSGMPGFARAIDNRTVQIDAQPAEGDPLVEGLRPGAPVGLLAIDLATRRRVRLNGTAEPLPDGAFHLRVAEVFGNCPKYIQRRELSADAPVASRGQLVRDARRVTPAQRAWIEEADTFIIATAHPTRGADASHRGGNPGFVRFVEDDLLVWPDYTGNMMFQTLGNLIVDPAAGLLFLDFTHGRTLQLTGRTEIVWDPTGRTGFPGAQRLIELRVERVVEIAAHLPTGWRFLDASPFNPS